MGFQGLESYCAMGIKFSYVRWAISRALLYNIVPIVYNIELSISKFKRVNLMLSGLLPHTQKRHEETLGGVGNVYYLDYGNSFMSVFICPNPLNCIP